LRRLALPNCTATEGIDLTRTPLLRHPEAVCALPAGVTALDLSHLQRLTRIGDVFGLACVALRDVRLPPSATASASVSSAAASPSLPCWTCRI
jgi:hypothetical protein